jgi:hypothetical protein
LSDRQPPHDSTIGQEQRQRSACGTFAPTAGAISTAPRQRKPPDLLLRCRTMDDVK